MCGRLGWKDGMRGLGRARRELEGGWAVVRKEGKGGKEILEEGRGRDGDDEDAGRFFFLVWLRIESGKDGALRLVPKLN